jgi:hypothetical protein
MTNLPELFEKVMFSTDTPQYLKTDNYFFNCEPSQTALWIPENQSGIKTFFAIHLRFPRIVHASAS